MLLTSAILVSTHANGPKPTPEAATSICGETGPNNVTSARGRNISLILGRSESGRRSHLCAIQRFGIFAKGVSGLIVGPNQTWCKSRMVWWYTVCGVQGLRVSAHSLTLWLETKILVPQRLVFIFILVGYPARRDARSASSIETHSKHLSQFWQFSSSHNGLSFKPHQLLYRKQALLRATSSHWLLEASIMMRSWPLCAECL
jgi:hypothetical protein